MEIAEFADVETKNNKEKENRRRPYKNELNLRRNLAFRCIHGSQKTCSNTPIRRHAFVFGMFEMQVDASLA